MKRISLIALRFVLEHIFFIAGLLNIAAFLSNIKSGEKKVIAFQSYSKHLAQLFLPIMDLLARKSEDIDLVFIILPHPHFSYSSLSELKNFVKDFTPIPEQSIYHFWECIWMQIDILVCTDVYAKFPINVKTKVLLKHGPGVNLRTLQRHFFRKCIHDFDAIFLNGQLDFIMIRNAIGNEIESLNLFDAGYAYNDRIFIPEEISYSLNVRKNKTKILFAPSWSVLKQNKNKGIDYINDVINEVSKFDVQIILKLHACSYNEIMAGMNWHEELVKYSANTQVYVDRNIDDIPAMKYSDILITDVSSRAHSFSLLNKPVIYFNRINAVRDEQDSFRMELTQSAFLTANEFKDLSFFIRGIMNKSINLPNNESINNLCFSNQGSATDFVVGKLFELSK